MRFAFVSRHNPTPEGSQDGKIFRALVEGLLREGHEVTAMSWAHDQPHDDMPPWCEYRAVPSEPGWRMHGRALVRPRWDAARIDWRPPADALPVAEDPLSWPVVAERAEAAVVFHYLTKIDAPALRRPSPADVQDMRHERHVARSAGRVLTMSARVAEAVGGATVVPMAYPIPSEAVDLVDAPVVALLASWNWPPNTRALADLLACWPAVRAAVSGARLLLAGRGLETMGVGTIAGVEQVGAVGVPADVLARAAVVAYPCPGTSGPKVKVIEALAHGVATLTTPSGVEGLNVDAVDDVVDVADTARFGDALIALLRDPARRAAMAQRGRQAVIAGHAPAVAARARIDALVGAARV